jgi:uncharacterized membrane protein
MKKGNAVKLAVTSIACLLPICLSFAIYSDLPDQLVMQWNFEGGSNWYAPKAVAAFALPLFFMALNIINLVVNNYHRRESVSKAMQILIAWFIPIISLIFVPLILLANLGVELPIKMIVFIPVGIVFIVTGNYLTKTRQNGIVGIRISWTLNNTENWNKTHWLARVLWIIGGLLFIVTAFLPLKNTVGIIVTLAILLMMIVVPIFYSFILHKKRVTHD